MEQLNVSKRRVCRALSQPRSTQRYHPKIRAGEERLVEQMISLATKYGRYEYRRITALLKTTQEKTVMVECSCIRQRPQFKYHVWSYDFVVTRTENGL